MQALLLARTFSPSSLSLPRNNNEREVQAGVFSHEAEGNKYPARVTGHAGIACCMYVARVVFAQNEAS